MKILSINISHNSSVALYNTEHKAFELFREEEKFNRIKHWFPFTNNCVFKSLYGIDFDKLAFSSADFRLITNTDEQVISTIATDLKADSFHFDPDNHHVYHALCGFHFSQFEEACCITMDGGGAQYPYIGFQEFENIFYVNKEKIENVYKHCNSIRFLNLRKIEKDDHYFFEPINKGFTREDYIDYMFDEELHHNPEKTKHKSIVFEEDEKSYFPLDYSVPAGMMFNLACDVSGFANFGGDAGKIMAISGYDSLESLREKNFNVVSEWKTQEEIFNLSKRCQKQLFDVSSALVEKASKISKNIILSGGCALNCVNNFLLVKRFPELNFFVDPVPHDGGTSLGCAIYFSHYENNYRRLRSS